MNNNTKPPLSREMIGLIGGKRRRGRRMNGIMIAASACLQDEGGRSKEILMEMIQPYLDGLSLKQERKLNSFLEEQLGRVDSLLKHHIHSDVVAMEGEI